MSFTESNTVEQMILDTAAQLGSAAENWVYAPGSKLSKGYL